MTVIYVNVGNNVLTVNKYVNMTGLELSRIVYLFMVDAYFISEINASFSSLMSEESVFTCMMT